MGILERLDGVSLLGLDAAVFRYHLEEHPVYISLTHELLAHLESGRLRAVTSTLTLLELTQRPYRLDQAWVARKYEALLVNFPNLTIAAIDRAAARRAAQLCARFELELADALQIAAGLTCGIQAYVTNRPAVARLRGVCPIILLDDCLQ